jgi:hypothetical protein
MAKMKGHSDAAQDKKLFGSMMKKATGLKKVKSHLKGDIKEQTLGIMKDKKLGKSLDKKASY